jgi:hypothetical protein
MAQDTRLENALRSLGGAAGDEMPEGFMDGVWLKAGQLTEAAEGRRRLALFAGVFAAGLGAGFWTMESPASEQPQGYSLIAGADLSPAALLHVQS